MKLQRIRLYINVLYSILFKLKMKMCKTIPREKSAYGVKSIREEVVRNLRKFLFNTCGAATIISFLMNRVVQHLA